MLINARVFLVLAIVILAGCNSSSSNGGASKPADSAGPSASTNVVHTTPVCAVQDCATHKVIDNGCTPSGECSSCINYCPPQNSITVTPSSTPLNRH